MRTRALGIAAAAAIAIGGGCGGDEDDGGGETGAGGGTVSTGAQTAERGGGENEAVRSCIEEAGFTTTVAGRTNPFSPGAPAPLFEILSTDARWVVMPAEAEPAMRKALRADLVAREGDLIVVSETTRPPKKIVDCLAS